MPPPPASPKNEVLLWDFEPPSLNKAFFFLAKGGIGGKIIESGRMKNHPVNRSGGDITALMVRAI